MHRIAPLLALLLLAPAAASAVDVAPIWEKKCAGCHGKDGTAQTEMGRKHKIDDLSTEKWQVKHSDAEIQSAIENGVKDTKMKAYRDKLKPEEIQALVTYIRGLKK